MAAITWSPTPTSFANSVDKPPPPSQRHHAAPTDSAATHAELQTISAAFSDRSTGSSDYGGSSLSVLQRLVWRHALLVNAVQELLLLLCVGIFTTVLAFSVDKTIEIMDMARARASQEAGSFLASYTIWTGSSLVLCGLSVACVHLIGPSAAGSGIPQMKCVLAGVQIHDYLSTRTLVAKAASLVLALAGGLSIGKEGPYVHMASCIAHQLCKLRIFRRLSQN